MFKALILYGGLGYTIYFILKYNNLIGVSKAVDNAIETEKKFKKDLQYQLIIRKVMSFFENIYFKLGFSSSPTKIADIEAIIKRLNITLGLSSVIPALSYLGFVKLLKFGGLFLLVWGYQTESFFFLILGCMGLLFDYIFLLVANKIIEDKDKELEIAFPKLYLMLYSRLTKGVKATLTPTLDSYLNSLKGYNTKGSEEIILFINRFKSNINLYNEFIAVTKMRDIYSNSAMIVNFSNLAIQALSGVNNVDKLTAFKVELNQRELALATKRAEKLFERGVKVQYLIFVILFQFILISWFSKAGESNIFSLFG